MPNTKSPKRQTTDALVKTSSKPKTTKSKPSPAAQLNAALYARVSAAEQQTLPMQLKQMSEYAKKRGWKISHKIEEIGSGAKIRPQREELLELAKQRKIDVIIVWRLDRWGRSVSDLIGTLQDLTDSEVG